MRQLVKSKELKIIIVTGSVGKTSAKVAIGQLLESSFKVSYSEDSYNTDIGLPLGLFGLKAPGHLWDIRAWNKVLRQIDQRIKDYPYDTVVIEVADDERSMMEPLVRQLDPQIAVVTGVAPVHMERLIDMERVVDDVWALGSMASEILYNADFAELKSRGQSLDSASGYGIDNGVIRFNQVKRSTNGFLKAELKIGRQSQIIATQFISESGLYNLLAATAVAHKMGFSFQQIVNGLPTIKPVNGRMNLLPGLKGARLIDDSYNSSPLAAIVALDVLHQFKGRHIAVLGSMNELGEYSVEAHNKVGRKSAETVDLLVVIGREAERHLAPAAIEAGLDKRAVKIFRTPYEAGHFVAGQIKASDTVLIKGSQDGVFSEEVTRILLAKNIDANQALVRQSATWRRKKKRAFAL